MLVLDANMNGKDLLILIFSLILLDVSPPVMGQSAKKVIVHGYGQCTNRNLKNLAVVINNGNMVYRLQNFILNGNLTIKEDLPKDFYVRASFYVLLLI